MTHEELVDQFRTLGVSDPEGWAASQRDEGIDQIARATVIRAVVDIVARSPETLAWIGEGDTPELRAAMVALGPSPELDLLAKHVAHAALFEILTLLDGSSEPERNPAGFFPGVARYDEERRYLGDIEALHDSLLTETAHIVGKDVVLDG